MHNKVHEVYMQRCLKLAKLGEGNVAPNPMVGAVLVHDGEIIGEGYHQNYGGPHAEVHCINAALKNYPDKIASATLYVSLEPCAHFGKTPPCADLIIFHKIPNVVIGCSDSFKEVNGKGIEKLKAAGVNIVVGICEKEAIALNKAFFCFHENKRPYVTLKWAQTCNGFIAAQSNERLMISNHYSNICVHQWRSENAAIMVGANTAIKDNPLLDNRYWMGTPPQKIIFDPILKAPDNLRLFNEKEVVIVLNILKDAILKNIFYLKIEKENILEDALRQLYNLNIQSIFVEGGQKLLNLFIHSNSWDEARTITNTNLFIQDGLPAPQLSNMEKLGATRLLDDEIVYFRNINNQYIHASARLF